MRFFHILFCLLFPLVLLNPAILSGQRLDPEVLFLGNSYTYVNNLPAILRELSVKGGDTLIHDQNAPGGATLNDHSTNATSINKINGRNWILSFCRSKVSCPSFSPGQVASQRLALCCTVGQHHPSQRFLHRKPCFT